MHTPTHYLTPQFIHRQTMMQCNANPMYPPTTSIAGWANSYIPQLRHMTNKIYYHTLA